MCIHTQVYAPRKITSDHATKKIRKLLFALVPCVAIINPVTILASTRGVFRLVLVILARRRCYWTYTGYRDRVFRNKQ